MAGKIIADVCLLLEGTYPYVMGGVSSWVDQVVRGLPDVRFALFYIGSRKELNPDPHYSLPPNVLSLTEVFLHDPLPPEQMQPGSLPLDVRLALYRTMEGFYLAESKVEQAAQFWTMLDGLREAGDRFTFGNLCHDREAWDILCQAYQKAAPQESFIDFFWTARFLHLPLWALWQARDRVPAARVYHAVSAGYAGLVGALAARQNRAPFVLTEHGIYTKERIAEISQADWIFESDRFHINYAEGLGKLKQLWINLFLFLGQVAYDTATRVTTLYEGNAATQIEFGADARRIQIIPNGIEPTRFDAIYRQHLQRWQADPTEKVVGFIGRVVPIKDVKTLMRAARLVVEKCPDVKFLIAGPYAEDPIYFEECEKIVKLLRLEEHVKFLGPQKLLEFLPRMDVLVLTSISEGLPLVVLEAMASGKPVVASDVGACRELIFGGSPEDKALGRCGRLTKILSPPETANALVAILSDPHLVLKMGTTGRKRAEQFYSMTKMLGSYRELYQRAARQPRAVESALAVRTPVANRP